MGARATQVMAQPRTEIEGLQMSSAVGVVGCGRWGSVHVQTLITMRSKGQIDRVVGCDIDAGKNTRLGQLDAMYSDAQTMLDSEQLDLVILATPNDTHEWLGAAILGASIHCLIEKPIASTSAGAQQLFDRAKDTDVFLTSGYLLRHHAGVKKLRELTPTGAVGALKNLTYRRHTARERPAKTNVVEGLASHGIDVAFFLGNDGSEVSLRGEDYFDAKGQSTTRENATKALLKFEVQPQASTSFEALIDVGWGQNAESREIIVEGAKGTASVDFGRHGSYFLNGSGYEIDQAMPPLEAQVIATLSQKSVTRKHRQAVMTTAILLDRFSN